MTTVKEEDVEQEPVDIEWFWRPSPCCFCLGSKFLKRRPPKKVAPHVGVPKRYVCTRLGWFKPWLIKAALPRKKKVYQHQFIRLGWFKPWLIKAALPRKKKVYQHQFIRRADCKSAVAGYIETFAVKED
jgi:hypothetical protein